MEADGSALCPVCGTSFMVDHCPGALGGPGMADPWGAGTEVNGKESPGICKGDQGECVTHHLHCLHLFFLCPETRRFFLNNEPFYCFN